MTFLQRSNYPLHRVAGKTKVLSGKLHGGHSSGRLLGPVSPAPGLTRAGLTNEEAPGAPSVSASLATRAERGVSPRFPRGASLTFPSRPEPDGPCRQGAPGPEEAGRREAGPGKRGAPGAVEPGHRDPLKAGGHGRQTCPAWALSLRGPDKPTSAARHPRPSLVFPLEGLQHLPGLGGPCTTSHPEEPKEGLWHLRPSPQPSPQHHRFPFKASKQANAQNSL